MTAPAVKIPPLTVVLAETRPGDWVGVKLTVASLARHAGGIDVAAYLGPALYPKANELRALHPGIRIFAYNGPENWSCKPIVMRSALADTPADDDRRFLWIDVDILLLSDPSRLAATPDDTLVIAQESNPNSNSRVVPRQQALGLTPGRPRATTLSSCVIGVTRRHEKLLAQWQDLMTHDAFLVEQAKPANQRKLFFGDQEVFEAVVCAPENAHWPVRVLHNFREMAQATFTHVDSAPPPRSADNAPLFLHATGNLKPWRSAGGRLSQEMFPYFRQGRTYRELMTPTERAAFSSRSPLAWTWHHLGGGFTTYQAFRHMLNVRRQRRFAKR